MQTMCPNRCRSCWWQEGGRCYNETFAIITTSNNRRYGELINDDTELRCCNSEGYLNKRTALSSVIPNDKLIILSEPLAGQN